MSPTEGLNFLEDVVNDKTAAVPFYVGLFTSSSFTPSLANVMSTFAAAAVEADEEYDQLIRQLWVAGNAVGGIADNTGNEATFDFNQSVTIYGAFLSTSNVKSGTAGGLVDVFKFTTPRVFASGDQLKLKYRKGSQNV